jgi:hypothetical protein
MVTVPAAAHDPGFARRLRWVFEWVNMERGVTIFWYDTQRVYAVKKAAK